MKNVTKKEILIGVLFYVFFSLLYRLVLWAYSGGYERDGIFGWADLKGYWLDSGMQYLFYFFASLLIWFLAIYMLKNKKTITDCCCRHLDSYRSLFYQGGTLCLYGFNWC
jgi:hypothetical protein